MSDKLGGCPSCGASEVLRIVYGLPSYELAEEVRLGKVALGGCVITGKDPEWRCAKCDHEWGRRPEGELA